MTRLAYRWRRSVATSETAPHVRATRQLPERGRLFFPARAQRPYPVAIRPYPRGLRPPWSVKRFRQSLAGFDVGDVARLHLLEKLAHQLRERFTGESVQPFDDPP